MNNRHSWLMMRPLMPMLLVLSTLASAAALAAAVPAALEQAAGIFPGEVQFLAYIPNDEAMNETLIAFGPFGDQGIEVYREQAALFKKRTGIDPEKHVTGLAIAGRMPEQGKPPELIVYAHLAISSKKLRELLKEEAEVDKRITFTKDDRGTVDEFGFRFLDDGVVVGSPSLIDGLGKPGSNAGAVAWAKTIAGAVPGAPRMLLAAEVPSQLLAGTNPAAAAMLSALSKLTIGLDEKTLGVHLTMRTPEMASGLSQQLKMLIQMGVKGLEAKSAQAQEARKSAIGLLAPELISARTTYLGVKRLADHLEVAPAGDRIELKIAREVLPNLGPSTAFAAVGIAAAVAIPNFRAAREKANVRACYAYQKTLAGASEMYSLDHNGEMPKKLDKEFLDTLKKEGYLQAIPDDPGQGEGTWSNYYLVDPKTFSMACKVHGNVAGTIKGTESPGESDEEASSGLAGALPGLTGAVGADPASGDPTKSCFAIQKTLLGAREMYQLDYNTKVEKLDDVLLDDLVKKGYLLSKPEDPGEGPGSWSHYSLTPDDGITCSVHGSVTAGPSGAAPSGP